MTDRTEDDLLADLAHARADAVLRAAWHDAALAEEAEAQTALEAKQAVTRQKLYDRNDADQRVVDARKALVAFHAALLCPDTDEHLASCTVHADAACDCAPVPALRVEDLASVTYAAEPAAVEVPEGFTAWSTTYGDGRPVHDLETWVEVIHRTGTRSSQTVGWYADPIRAEWYSKGHALDIVAYRVIEPNTFPGLASEPPAAEPTDAAHEQDPEPQGAEPDAPEGGLVDATGALDEVAAAEQPVEDGPQTASDLLDEAMERLTANRIADAALDQTIFTEGDLVKTTWDGEKFVTERIPASAYLADAADPDARTGLTPEGEQFLDRIKERIGNAGKPIEAYAPTARVWSPGADRSTELIAGVPYNAGPVEAPAQPVAVDPPKEPKTFFGFRVGAKAKDTVDA